MRGKPFVDKRFSPAPPSKKLFSGRAVGPRRWTAESGQRPVDRKDWKRKAFCLPLLVLGAYGVPCVRSVRLGTDDQHKMRRAESLPRFLSWAAPLCQRAVCLGHFAGGPAMVTVRRYTGESVLLHKARWEEDGGLGEGGTFVRKPATEGGRRPCPLRRRELRASTAGQGPSFPQKSLLTYGRSAGGARRGSCGRRPACDRRG